jgi:hypothetical protein
MWRTNNINHSFTIVHWRTTILAEARKVAADLDFEINIPPDFNVSDFGTGRLNQARLRLLAVAVRPKQNLNRSGLKWSTVIVLGKHMLLVNSVTYGRVVYIGKRWGIFARAVLTLSEMGGNIAAYGGA